MGDLLEPNHIQATGPIKPAQAYDIAALDYDSWEWQRVWYAVERTFILDVLRTHGQFHRVLDVGCGTGTLLGQIQRFATDDAELTGIDVSAGMIKRAREKFQTKPITFIRGNFLNHHFRKDYFDIVFMFRVASHIEKLSLYLAKVASVLKRGGIFALSDVHNEHRYDYTKLPHLDHKIRVNTFKHRIPEIVDIAGGFDLIPFEIKTSSVDDLPPDLRQDPNLPRTLQDYVKNQVSTPFGFQIRFELRKS